VPGYPLDSSLGGAKSLYGRYGEEKNLASTGNRTSAFQPVARRYNKWAIPALSFYVYRKQKMKMYIYIYTVYVGVSQNTVVVLRYEAIC
jgi:hypothetical protein